jgi:hypothetical protein
MTSFFKLSQGDISGADLAEMLYRDVLSCDLCHQVLEIPPSPRAPKCLECAHYFCAVCLESYVEHRGIFSQITCPACRAESTVGRSGISGLQSDVAVVRTLSKLQSLNLSQRPENPDVFNCQFCMRDRMWYVCLTCSGERNRLCSGCNTNHKDTPQYAGHRTVLAGAGITAMSVPGHLHTSTDANSPSRHSFVHTASYMIESLYDLKVYGNQECDDNPWNRKRKIIR